MLGGPTFRHVAPHARPGGAWSGPRAVVAFGAMAMLGGWSCFPEQALSSYMRGAGSIAGVVTSTSTNRADAGSPAFDAGPPPAAVDAGVLDAGGSPDANGDPPPEEPRLACREECVCEPQGALEFMLCAAPVTRATAIARCDEAGGSLVSVDDEAQNSWLSERMQALEADDFWLSGTDADTEGVWVWGDGRVFFGGDAGAGRFVPWDEGQPNDVNGEDCMRATAGVWRDLDCADEIAYVCQG